MMSIEEVLEQMRYIDCKYYQSNFRDFDGCPGLDYAGDDEDCGDCPYRLFKVQSAPERGSGRLM